MITIDGLATGIDTDRILNGLLQLQKGRIDRLQLQKQEVQRRQTAFQSVEAGVMSLRSSLSRLARSTSNVFNSKIVSLSAEGRVQATAAAHALPGSYELTVESIARTHQVASQVFASAEVRLAEGTLELGSGSGPRQTLQIDQSNNTLSGLATAINQANVNVTASVVQDAQGVRLLLSSSRSGIQQALHLSLEQSDPGPGTQAISFDLDQPVQAAADTVVRIGHGPGALLATSDTTRLMNVLPGINLDVLRADPSTSVTLQVRHDVNSGVSAVEDFVASYNQLTKTIAEHTRFDPQSQSGGLLLGEGAVIEIQRQLQAGLQSAIQGVQSGLNRVTALGVRFNNDGTLSLNSGRLRDVLEGNVPGLQARDVQRLFSLAGESSHPGISFVAGSSRTRPTMQPVGVEITRAAEPARLVSESPLAGVISISSAANSLQLRIEGITLDIRIDPGDYTPAALATQLTTTINSQPALQGRRMAIELQEDGALQFRTEAFGRQAELTLLGGELLPQLNISPGMTSRGVDVAGQFHVEGQIEQAAGNGRLLTGLSGNKHTADLQLRVALNPGQVQIGETYDLQVTQGVAARMDAIVGKLLDLETGRLGTANRSYAARAETLQKSIDRQQQVFEQQRARMLQELIGLESAVSKVQGLGALLGNQLAALNPRTRT
jgi:flagellar hook-associated protein 2